MDDTTNEAPNQQLFCELSTAQLLTLAGGFADELLRRAHAEEDSAKKRLLHLGACHLVELKGRLRLLRARELESPPAAPVPDSLHGAEEPGAPIVRAPSGAGDTTTTGAAGVFLSRCYFTSFGGKHGGGTLRFRCSLPQGHPGSHFDPLAVPALVPAPPCERCKEDLGHEGECRPIAEQETAPTLNSPDSAAGAARAEGADQEGAEGDRLQSSGGRVELADHLRMLKGGAA